ncbi:MAG: hypothetical protein V3S14_06595, partial [Anaerolineae bacterium]
MLKLAGKDPDDAFPEGTWQFYVDYALREDTARHANETHGFDTALNQHQIHLSAVDRITAWTMAAIHCLHQSESGLIPRGLPRSAGKKSLSYPAACCGVVDYTIQDFALSSLRLDEDEEKMVNGDE